MTIAAIPLHRKHVPVGVLFGRFGIGLLRLNRLDPGLQAPTRRWTVVIGGRMQDVEDSPRHPSFQGDLARSPLAESWAALVG
jgi:hypothetical protein